MKLDDVEKMARWAGAAGALAFTIAAYVGLASAARQRRGRVAGHTLGFVRSSWSYYVPASIVGLGAMYRLWRPLPLRLSKPARTAALLVGVPLYFAGIGIMLWGRFTLGKMYNISTSARAELFERHELVTAGPFSIVRHPMYLGGLMAEIGALLIYRTWAALIIAVSYPNILLRARREEEALAAEFGDRWADYARRVPAIIPRIGG